MTTPKFEIADEDAQDYLHLPSFFSSLHVRDGLLLLWGAPMEPKVCNYSEVISYDTFFVQTTTTADAAIQLAFEKTYLDALGSKSSYLL